MARTNLGRVVPLHKGDYKSDMTYELNDVVSYNHSLYWHYTDDKTVGVVPTDETVWKVVLDISDAEQYIQRAENAASDAESSKSAAKKAEEGSIEAKQSAEEFKTSAENSKNEAEEYRNQAESAVDKANFAANTSAEYASAAMSAKIGAETAADSAKTAQINADRAMDTATQAASDAASAKTGAETAKEHAETAEAEAKKSQSAAKESEDNAVTAKESAETAKSAAETAKDDAEKAKTDAETAKTLAEQSEESAANSASDSANSAEKAREYAAQAEISASRTYKRYIARWNKSTAQMTRMGDAEGITTDTTNFAHLGSVNENYNNPFDLLYPWSERRLCNIDIPTYMSLTAGADIRDCVVAWEGDTNFSYSHQYGVWVYTPEFWGDSWDDGDYRYYEVCDREVPTKHHYPAQIGGRWHGRPVNITIDGVETTCFLPTLGMPGRNEAMSKFHAYARAYGATLDTIWSMDASTLLYLVEYASWNSQAKLGQGVSSLYRENDECHFLEASTGNMVKVSASITNGMCIHGVIMDIGTTKSGNQVASCEVLSTETVDDVMTITLDKEVTVTTDNFWSIHGKVNTADTEIGSKSGYIGGNSKSSAYYRGEDFYGNQYRYVLGAYHEGGTDHLWLAHNIEEADTYDALNINVHIDTGVVLAPANGYVKSLAQMRASGLHAAPVCIEIGGSSDNPVGDYHYGSTTANTVLLVGGSAFSGAIDGRCYGGWDTPAGYSYWIYGACPLLKTP